jgi:hypothetical protein
MKILGDPIFTRDATGRLKSRIGTIFLKSVGLVTIPGIHATQRLAWSKELNRVRAEAGQPELTYDEFDDEMAQSVDLLFDDRTVLIRPDPSAMDLAFKADDLLQTLVSKRSIRYLNTQHASVRDALRAHGENWRMSQLPVSSEDICNLITSSLAPIEGLPIYFYNHSTGTRFLTLGKFAGLENHTDDVFRKQLQEIVHYSAKRNRFGYPEIDIFPQDRAFTRQAFEALDAGGLPIDALRAAYRKLLDSFRKTVPAVLRDETLRNIEWRNLMCKALTLQPNAVVAEDLIQDLSPEFYRQIEWLPGCRTEKGEIIFDPVFEELDARPGDAELRAFCDPRAKAVIFNYLREYGTIEHINIGRIRRPLSLRTQALLRRAMVYIVQLKEATKPEPELRILRFQKWGVKEHLDDDKGLLRSVMESMDYTDYVLDRRLGCRQLGMNLPDRLSTGRIAETYCGLDTKHHGSRFWTVYFERAYVIGCATDKILSCRHADPEFNRRLARLLGEAASVNCIVGRANLEDRVLFDDGDEVIVAGEDGYPDRLIVSDHTGAFKQYKAPLIQDAEAYAEPVNRRTQSKLMDNAEDFAQGYLTAFQSRFEQVQREYRNNRLAFDTLFKHRPLDREGSVAFRWKCVLERLDATDAAELTRAIRSHIAGR